MLRESGYRHQTTALPDGNFSIEIGRAS